MKDFITPEIEDISELTEGVYADSASGNSPEFICHVSKRWSNHNTGHHSTAHINVYVEKGGSLLHSVTVTFGLPIRSFSGISTPGPFPSVTKVSDNCYRFYSANGCNNGESLGFSFNDVLFNNPTYSKCLGTEDESCSYDHRSGECTNQNAPDSEICVSINT